jgi:hypothetical protein
MRAPLAATVAAIALAGCVPLRALNGTSDVGASILGNLQGCDRHYSGSLGVGVAGSFEIDCKAQATPPPATPLPDS